MKHVEYGMTFYRKKYGVWLGTRANPIDGNPDWLCTVIDSFYLLGILPSIDYLIIEPLGALIDGTITEMESLDTNPGVTIEFTASSVFLKMKGTLLRTIPSEDFRQIVIEWRDFANAS